MSGGKFPWVRWLAAGVLLLGIAALHFLGLDDRLWPWLKENLTLLEETVGAYFAWSLILFFAAYVLVTGLSVPVSILLGLAAGALFGRWWGTGLINFASTSGATVAFLASRHLLGNLVQQSFGPRLAVINRGVERDGAYYLLTLRLIPMVPFFLVNLGMGLTRMRLRTYWWATQLGMLPANFLVVNAGTELGQLQSPHHLLSPVVLLSLLLLTIFPLSVLVLRAFR